MEVLPLPLLKAAGIEIPKEKGNMWAPVISRADYSVNRGKAVEGGRRNEENDGIGWEMTSGKRISCDELGTVDVDS